MMPAESHQGPHSSLLIHPVLLDDPHADTRPSYLEVAIGDPRGGVASFVVFSFHFPLRYFALNLMNQAELHSAELSWSPFRYASSLT